MLRKFVKIYVLLDVAISTVGGILAILIIGGFCINNDLPHKTIIVIAAIILGYVCISAFYTGIKEIINIMKA
jgi:hypothetical protein